MNWLDGNHGAPQAEKGKACGRSSPQDHRPPFPPCSWQATCHPCHPPSHRSSGAWQATCHPPCPCHPSSGAWQATCHGEPKSSSSESSHPGACPGPGPCPGPGSSSCHPSSNGSKTIMANSIAATAWMPMIALKLFKQFELEFSAPLSHSPWKNSRWSPGSSLARDALTSSAAAVGARSWTSQTLINWIWTMFSGEWVQEWIVCGPVGRTCSFWLNKTHGNIVTEVFQRTRWKDSILYRFHRLHVWYIYHHWPIKLENWPLCSVKLPSCVGKYAIHGLHGYGMEGMENHWWKVRPTTCRCIGCTPESETPPPQTSGKPWDAHDTQIQQEWLITFIPSYPQKLNAWQMLIHLSRKLTGNEPYMDGMGYMTWIKEHTCI